MRACPSALRGLAIALGGACWAQVTQRVSVGSDGAQGNGPTGAMTRITPDGRYVIFSSQASNLVPGDSNGVEDVFVRDRLTGATERVSVDSSGVQGNGRTYAGSISADGRFVALASQAYNLVAFDQNGFNDDIFVRDRQAGTTVLVSVSSSGVQGNYISWSPLISADGQHVAFTSWSSNLVGGDANFALDAFVHDRLTGATELVSVAMGGGSANDHSGVAWISADGRFVTFDSDADDLVPADTNAQSDAFVRDRVAGTTERVSVDSSGVQGNGASAPTSISADGRFVAFPSEASNLVPGDTNGRMDAFVRDRLAGTTERVSVGAGGVQGDGDTGWVALSGDGRYVAFASEAANFVPGDTNGFHDGFVRDRLAGTIERVSVGLGGAEGDGWSSAMWISDDGRHVLILSSAGNLVPGDTNAAVDAFVRDRVGGTSFTSLCHPGVGGVIACPCSNPPGAAGRGCDNSAGTGGAILSASGGTFLSSDSLVFTTSGERPMSLSLLFQGNAEVSTGAIHGQGVRCAGGALERLFLRQAAGGSISVPDFAAGDPSLSARSAALGDAISPGQSRWYAVYYRDPIVLGGCPAASTFNATQTGVVTWSP